MPSRAKSNLSSCLLVGRPTRCGQIDRDALQRLACQLPYWWFANLWTSSSIAPLGRWRNIALCRGSVFNQLDWRLRRGRLVIRLISLLFANVVAKGLPVCLITRVVSVSVCVCVLASSASSASSMACLQKCSSPMTESAQAKELGATCSRANICQAALHLPHRSNQSLGSLSGVAESEPVSLKVARRLAKYHQARAGVCAVWPGAAPPSKLN